MNGSNLNAHSAAGHPDCQNLKSGLVRRDVATCTPRPIRPSSWACRLLAGCAPPTRSPSLSLSALSWSVLRLRLQVGPGLRLLLQLTTGNPAGRHGGRVGPSPAGRARPWRRCSNFEHTSGCSASSSCSMLGASHSLRKPDCSLSFEEQPRPPQVRTVCEHPESERCDFVLTRSMQVQ